MLNVNSLSGTYQHLISSSKFCHDLRSGEILQELFKLYLGFIIMDTVVSSANLAISLITHLPWLLPVPQIVIWGEIIFGSMNLTAAPEEQ